MLCFCCGQVSRCRCGGDPHARRRLRSAVGVRNVWRPPGAAPWPPCPPAPHRSSSSTHIRGMSRCGSAAPDPVCRGNRWPRPRRRTSGSSVAHHHRRFDPESPPGMVRFVAETGYLTAELEAELESVRRRHLSPPSCEPCVPAREVGTLVSVLQSALASERRRLDRILARRRRRRNQGRHYASDDSDSA
jgi:hypothetical protein